MKQCDSGDYTLYKDADILEVEGMDPITPSSSGSKVSRLKSELPPTFCLLIATKSKVGKVDGENIKPPI